MEAFGTWLKVMLRVLVVLVPMFALALLLLTNVVTIVCLRFHICRFLLERITFGRLFADLSLFFFAFFFGWHFADLSHDFIYDGFGRRWQDAVD